MQFDEIMQGALDAGVEAVGADAGAIEVRDADGWIVRYQHGFTAAEIGERLSEADAPNATAAARSAAPVVIADVDADELADVGFVKAHKLKSVLAVPLGIRGLVTGCLLFYGRKVRTFTPEEVDFGRRLGTAVSLALENARLLDEERHVVRRVETLNAINEIVRSTATPAELLARLVGEVSVVAGADMSLVVEVEGGRLTVTHVRNVSEDLVGVAHDVQFYPVFGMAARAKHPMLVSDAWSDPRTN